MVKRNGRCMDPRKMIQCFVVLHRDKNISPLFAVAIELKRRKQTNQPCYLGHIIDESHTSV